LISVTLLTGCAAVTRLAEQVRNAAGLSTPTAQATLTPTLTAIATAVPTATPTPTEVPCDRSAGGRVSREKLDSAILGYSYEVSVYTPPCYDKEGIAYPVLYLLHGQGMDDTYWLGLGAAELVDKMIADGATPFLMVMPREVDDYAPITDNGFGASVLTELLPWVEAHYDVCPRRECRAIGGISRGGGWATRLVARNFDTFGALGAHSMGLLSNDAWQMKNNLENHTVDEFPRIWVDRGVDDFLYEGIDYFVETLVEEGIPHELHIWPGVHNGEYWQAHVAEYLAWYAAGWE